MRITTALGVASLAIALAGCASTPPPQVTPESFGPPPSETVIQKAIISKMELALKDPDSAKYKFGKPFRAWSNKALVYGGGFNWAGWAVEFHVNAKNSFGGYNGFKPYTAGFKDGEVMGIFEGTNHVLFHRYDQ